MNWPPWIALTWMLSGADAVAAEPTTPNEAFWGRYASCDRDLLAAAWGVDAYEAKARAGALLLGGREEEVEAVLAGQREAIDAYGFSTCPYYDHGYAYEDMEALAALWEVDILEAKIRAERKLLDGNDATLRDWVQTSRGGRHDEVPDFGAPSDAEIEAVQAWGRADRPWCELELLAAVWVTDTWEVKVKAGTWILHEGLATYARRVKAAAKQVQEPVCSTWDLGITDEEVGFAAMHYGVDEDTARELLILEGQRGRLAKVRKALERVARKVLSP